MASPASVTTVEAYLQRKFLFRPDAMAQAIQDQDPALAALTRRSNIGQDNRVPIDIAPTRGISGNITKANANAQAGASDKFVVNGVKTYITVKIDAEDIDKAASSENSLVNIVDTEMRGGQARMSQGISSAFMGDAGGSIGKVKTVATTLVTLEDEIPATWLNKDEIITASANDGTDAAHTQRVGSATLAATDRQAKTLTATANWTSAITSFAVGDYLFIEGMFGGDQGLRNNGLRGWYPAGTPLAMQGVTRTTDRQRLAGFSVDGSKKGLTSGLTQLGAFTTAYGGRPNMVIVHPERYAALLDQLDSNLVQQEQIGRVSFTGIRFVTGAGPAMVFSNPSADLDKAYLLQTSDWILAHVGSDLVRFRRNNNGGLLHFQGGNDKDEYHIYMIANYDFSCRAPGRGGVVHSLV